MADGVRWLGIARMFCLARPTIRGQKALGGHASPEQSPRRPAFPPSRSIHFARDDQSLANEQMASSADALSMPRRVHTR